MIEYQDQLKLQAYLDGELPEREGREVANRLAQDQEAVALLGELRQTRKALAGVEAGVRLPESREFYWSKIARQIEREAPAAAAEPVQRISVLTRLRRMLMPAAGLAVLALAGLIASKDLGRTGAAATALADPGGFTYHDYAAGATLVWLPYDADNNVADAGDTDTVKPGDEI
jgi:anti-sigma factor RsiW